MGDGRTSLPEGEVLVLHDHRTSLWMGAGVEWDRLGHETAMRGSRRI